MYKSRIGIIQLRIFFVHQFKKADNLRYISVLDTSADQTLWKKYHGSNINLSDCDKLTFMYRNDCTHSKIP